MIAIIDYEAGNIKSVDNAMKYLGREAVLTRDRDIIAGADRVILPGVGAFGDAMSRIREFDLEEVIHHVADKGTPFLGICLGQQLLFESSQESPGVEGLGILPGSVLRIPDGEGRKVPQLGWNDLAYPVKGRLFEGVPEGSFVYFVHSYYVDAADRDIVTATTWYGTRIDASVQKDNVFACQFHPEKSEAVGMQILRNFLRA